MGLVRKFGQLKKGELPLAGGKGASLIQMARAGLPVPAGYIVLSNAFAEFIDAAGLRDQVDDLLISARRGNAYTERKAVKIRSAIYRKTIPKETSRAILREFDALRSRYVAVRSSANVEDSVNSAWAGQFESFLHTTRRNLIRNIKRCWAASFSPHAVLYWQKRAVARKPLAMAVVVQKMIRSEVSGIAFSINPQTGDRDEILLEAARGTGDRIVRGQVSPHLWIVRKRPRRLLPTVRTGKIRISNATILKLARLVLRTEKLFHFPTDVEWTYARRKLYVLQARPISVPGPLHRNSVSQPPWEVAHATTRQTGSGIAIQSSDYFLNFKASGLPLFFAEVLRKAHEPLNVLLAYSRASNNTYWEYAPLSELSRARDYAAKRYLSPLSLKKYTRRLRIVFSQGERELNHILRSPFTRSDVESFVRQTEAMFAIYAKMDPLYTDLLYSRRGTSRRFKKIAARFEKLKAIYRTRLNGLYFQQDACAAKIMDHIAAQFSLKPSDIRWYTPSDLIALFDGNRVSSGQMGSRQQSYLLLGNSKHPRDYYGQRALPKIRKLARVPRTQFIQGQVASAGNGRPVIGKVRRLQIDFSQFRLVRSKLRRMKNNEILVVSATGPELLEAMYKASAIVTDVGGLLSHAAITSRELGIPCIVNTRFCTDVLKTGDLVEVDPLRGTIRRLQAS